MIHELKNIIKAYLKANAQKSKAVLATVVALEGSSYRRPGVRMLILDNGDTVGAVSGGCVEKEVIRQAQSVFENGVPKIMTYDGRYRLGCEGILYILIEPFEPDADFLKAFEAHLQARRNLGIAAYFSKTEGTNVAYGSVLTMDQNTYHLRTTFETGDNLEVFDQELAPCFKLLIIGAEHDAVQLGSYASLTGWEVKVVAGLAEEKTISDFPGAQELYCIEPESLALEEIDGHSAVLLMTHSYVKDLKYLLKLKDSRPAYLGVLGPAKRRERLLGELIERHPEIDDAFFDGVHGPAGLNIGAETAQEIAIAVMAEILAVVRKQDPIMLKNKLSRIHSQ